MLQLKKQKQAFLWVILGASLLLANFVHAEGSAPWRDYTVREREANRLVLEVQYANEMAEHCVLTTGEGTVFPALSEDQSFVWNGEKRELTLQWNSPRLELALAYEAAISAPLWQEGTPYEDELVFLLRRCREQTGRRSPVHSQPTEWPDRGNGDPAGFPFPNSADLE